MIIKKVKIKNFKCFRQFDLTLNDEINLLVGNNEAGKSTLLEAIHLALTGILNGRILRHELSQHVFNNEAVQEYFDSFGEGRKPQPPPEVSIELFLEGNDLELLEGDDHTENSDGKPGVMYKISFNDRHQTEYERFVQGGNIKAIPIEYYDVSWRS